MVDYVVAFDLAREGYTTWRLAIAPAVFGIAMATLAFQSGSFLSVRGRPGPGFYRTLAGMAAVALFGISVSSVAETWTDYKRLVDALRNGRFRVVEGPVTNFIPGGPGGHGSESFRVDSASFAYDAATTTSAFHRTRPYGGPVRDGLRVRIWEVDGAIVRLEVFRHDSATSR